MADFTSEIAAQILSASQESTDDVAGTFARAFGGEFSVAVGESSTLSADAVPDSWNGPGLVITFHVGDSGAMLLLPEASGLLPDWYVEPDDTGSSKLATLAQELGYSILPEEFTPEKASAVRVKDLAGTFARAEPEDGVGLLSLTLSSGDHSGEASFVWPLQAVVQAREEANVDEQAAGTPESAPSDATVNVAPEAAEIPQASPEPFAAAQSPAAGRLQYSDIDDGIRQLPKYAKSLLKVRVPVTVTLASSKYPVSQVLELGPGSIIQFNKSCEDNLHLEVGDHSIAEGEAVKVGDKFGLWITSMTMPDERFWVIHGRRSGARVK